MEENNDTPNCKEIPQDNFIRRPRKYTITPEVIEQRRNAGKAPKGDAVARNSWKHGRYSKNKLLAMIPPCRTTCRDHPCSLVDEGKTKPGGDCLDKQEVIQVFASIMTAIKNRKEGDQEGFEAELGLLNASNLMIYRKIQQAITEDGVMLRDADINKEGEVIGYHLKPHPLILSLIKMSGEMGITPRDLGITPKERARNKSDEKGAESLDKFLSGLTRKTQD